MKPIKQGIKDVQTHHFILLSFKFYFMGIGILPTLCLCTTCMRGPYGDPANGLIDGYKLLYVCWKLNLDPLLLTTELSSAPSRSN